MAKTDFTICGFHDIASAIGREVYGLAANSKADGESFSFAGV
jgi:hypothetical protein